MISPKTILFAVFLFALTAGFSQARKEDLQKQRDQLNEQIALTRKLIREAETKQKLTSNQLAVLREQIRYREALIANISQEIRQIDGEIRDKESHIARLQADLNAMKAEYAAMIRSAYSNRSEYDKLMYVFAADDFNQAYKRFKITQHYALKRKEQVAAIQKKQSELTSTVTLLQEDKKAKESLASAKAAEKSSISKDKQEQENKLSTLRSEEKKLRDQQKKQEADRKKLTARIEEIIRAEIEAERKKAAAAAAASGTTPSDATKLELAPEVRLINTDFEKNRGSLPWPVKSGVITSRFGRQAHSSIAGIEVDNKGIDFTTEKDGSVRAVFDGTVTSVFAIPGAGQNVIITHGSYKSVYSGLSEVNVSVGSKVRNQETIGKVMFNGEEHVLHFEIWKVSSESGAAQNPELWIKRR
jgi:murein hydrolase activator